MSTVRYYRHDDAGAPVLSGTVGSLTALLRAVLVGTAGIAYGSKPSAGWSESFIGSAANIAAFRNNTVDGASGAFFRVHDNAPGTGGAREATVQGFATMTDVNTGTEGNTPIYVRKSATLTSAARPWLVIADGKTVYLYLGATGDASSYRGRDTAFVGFGDYWTMAGTNYRYFCLGRSNQNSIDGDTIPALRAGGAGPSFTVFNQSGVGAIVQPTILFVPHAGGAIGGSDYPTSLLSGDVYFYSDPYIYNGTTPLGRLRGLLLPFTNLTSSTVGVDYPGLTGKIMLNSRITASSNVNFGAHFLLDTVGPWL